MSEKTTYYIDGRPAAIVETIQHKTSCKLLGLYQVLLLFLPNEKPVESDSEVFTSISTVSDLKKIAYGKDTFIIGD